MGRDSLRKTKKDKAHRNKDHNCYNAKHVRRWELQREMAVKPTADVAESVAVPSKGKKGKKGRKHH